MTHRHTSSKERSTACLAARAFKFIFITRSPKRRIGMYYESAIGDMVASMGTFIGNIFTFKVL